MAGTNPKREYQQRNWCFTLNNYTEEEVKCIKEQDVQYLIFGKEKGENGTEHLQGYFQFKKRIGIRGLKKILERAHWEKARGTPEQNIAYCSKDKQIFTKGEVSKSGKVKVDMVKAAIQTSEGIEITKLLEEHGSGYIMHKRKIDEIAKGLLEERNKKQRLAEYETATLNEWQEKAVKALKEQNNRQILFIVDYEGGKGKTWLSLYIIHKFNGIRFENGKSNDIKFLYNGENFVVFDFCKHNMEFINYEIIESIKNGVFNSMKYMPMKKYFPQPKVIVMMNQPPDERRMSTDRFVIHYI